VATSLEISRINEFIGRIVYLSSQIEELESLASTIGCRYDFIVSGLDSYISAETWNNVLGEDSVIISGGVDIAKELPDLISGWRARMSAVVESI
jgi:hypothetical protein